jgi:hypothetical protein
MAVEATPEVWTAIFAKLAVEGDNRTRIALGPIAQAIEKQAKINASSGTHLYGTPTPAWPDSGPAIISGTLRRSITHSPIRAGFGGWMTEVGTGIGLYPTYGRGLVPANKYGYYLEIAGLRNGAKYPFLIPAFHFVMGVPVKLIYDEIYGKSWSHLVY